MAIESDRWFSLLKKSERATLSPDELAAVLRRLRDPFIDPYDKYPLIGTLANARVMDAVPDLEKCLNERQAPQIAGAALEALTLGLGLTKRYLPQLRSFVAGLLWDDAEVARLIAISVAGECLRADFDVELLSLLLDIVEGSGEREVIRDAAKDSLARAMGVEWQQVSRQSRDDILRRARERLG